jgi:O-antigen ligase
MYKFMSQEEFKKYNSKNLPKDAFNNIIKKMDDFNNDGGLTTYWGAWRGGIQQGLESPIFGIGPSGTRKTCKDLSNNSYAWIPGTNYCGNHPHNFYVQMFAETGLIGLLLGSLMIISLISSCYRARENKLSCPMISIAFVIPLALFFPLQLSGSFFGQWGNLFIWFAIGFAISQVQNFNIKNNFEVKDDQI